MNRFLFGALGALALTACSGGETPADDAADAAPRAMALEEMHLPDANTYCNLMKAGHDFVYDDPQTWMFIFVTDVMGDPQPATVRIAGKDVALEEVSRTTGEDQVQTWQYRSEDGEIGIELKVRETGGGQEYTDYEGTIAITDPVQSEPIDIYGDCGV